MLRRNIAVLIVGGLLSAQVTVAAADQSTFPYSVNEVSSEPTPAMVTYLEQRAAANQAASLPLETVKISAATQHVNVEHLQTVKIENDQGQSFVWRADTLASGADNFPLQAIAPKGFGAGQTRVFLSHPHEHMLHN